MCEPDKNNRPRPPRTSGRDFNDCFAAVYGYRNGLPANFLAEESSKLQFIAFVSVMLVSAGRIALVKQTDSPYVWTLPRIKVEEVADDLSAFASKLLAEVCGCQNSPKPQAVSNKMRDNNKLDAYYLAIAPEGVSVTPLSNDKQTVQFFDLSQLPSNIQARDLAQIQIFKDFSPRSL